MRQSIVLILGLVLAASCSNDPGGEVVSDPTTNKDNPTASWKGSFQGEWRLSYYGAVSEGSVEVGDSTFEFSLPSEYLLPRLGLVDEASRRYYPDEPFYQTTSEYIYDDSSQRLRYTIQGYSAEAIYAYVSASPFYLGVKADGVSYRIGLYGEKEQSTAVFDIATGLWRLALIIDKIVIVNQSTGRQIVVKAIDEKRSPEKSAWQLVFRAARRIGEP